MNIENIINDTVDMDDTLGNQIKTGELISDLYDSNEYKKIYNTDVYELVNYFRTHGYEFEQVLEDDRIDRFELMYNNNEYVIIGICGHIDSFSINNGIIDKYVTMEEFFSALKLKMPEYFCTYIPINTYLEKKKEKQENKNEMFSKMSLTERLIFMGQDIYWTGNPTATKFKAIYRRHTDFDANKIDFDANKKEFFL